MKPFKINEPVTHARYGLGVVTGVDGSSIYPIEITFSNGDRHTFTEKGKYVEDDHCATLIHGHHDKINVVPVKPRPVKLKDITQL